MDRYRGPFVELSGVAAILATSALTAAIGGTAFVVVMVALVTTVPVAVWMTRVSAARQAKIAKIYRDGESEIDRWRDRLQTLSFEAQQTTTALSLMIDGVVMLNGSSEIVLINPAARKLLALSAEQDLTGRPFIEVVRIPKLSRAVAAARAGDGAQNLVAEISDGEVVRPIKVRVDRFTNIAENNLLMTLRDETEAHRVDEMRREFVANISHELKTPLAAIKGYAETVELAIKDDPDAAVHFMTQIHSQCLRLERLISDMMELARAQSGRSLLKITSVSMSDVITESLKSYQPVAEANQVTLTVDNTSEARVKSDVEATLTIANNLIGNAIEHTPAGGEVRVCCRKEGKCWALVVEDTGIGISAADQKRIFERFYRVRKSRNSADGGTGIGLSIVKNLTMALGGEVRLSSKPGEGSRFEVLLPQEDAAEPN